MTAKETDMTRVNTHGNMRSHVPTILTAIKSKKFYNVTSTHIFQEHLQLKCLMKYLPLLHVLHYDAVILLYTIIQIYYADHSLLN